MTAAGWARAAEALRRHRVCVLATLAGLCVAAVAAAGVTYLFYPGYVDHGEPSVALIAWRLLDGAPAYPAFDAPNRIGNLYGPYIFLTHALSYLLAGPGVAQGKAAGALAPLLIVAVVFASQRARGLASGLVAAVFAAGFVLTALPATVWNRPDALVALLVALAVWAMNGARSEGPEWGRTVAIGVCGGIAVGMKLYAGVYFVPVALFHCRGPARGAKALIVIAAAGAAATAAPFASPLFPLADYLAWFPKMAGKPTDLGALAKVARYSLFYFAPVLVYLAALKWAERPLGRAETVYLGGLVGCGLLLFPLAAKPGAGWYYMVPFLAVSIDQIVRFSGPVVLNAVAVRSAVVAVAVLMLAISVPTQKRFYDALHWQAATAAAAEAESLIARYPGRTIEMGVGRDLASYFTTLQKTRLVLAGHPYTLDAAVVTESSMLKIPVSDATVAMIRGCSTDIWLIPKGEPPFAMTGYYGNPMFGPAFVDAFRASYGKTETLDVFDVWTCRNPT